MLRFVCTHCSHSGDALVIGVGQGSGNSPYLLDESGAKDRAANRATSAAEENAKFTLAAARCPKCGKRDESRISSLRLQAIGGVVLVLVALPLLGLLIDALKRTTFGVTLFGVIAVPTAFFVYWSQRWKWTTIDNRVAFLDAE